MLLIESNTTNPYFNIAAEEYLLKNFTDDCFVLYQNEPSIIVGKHQNTFAEINYPYTKEKNIPIVRRLSGGGTVYHDLGNLNFAFLKNTENEKNIVDFKKYTEPIIKVLNQLGVNAKLEGHNDIRVNGFKISGNAEHVFKKRVLHHGTLLFSSNLGVLNEAIKAPVNKFSDKAVKSVRSNVANIKDYLNKEISIIEFKNSIFQLIKYDFIDVLQYSFNSSDLEQIQKLITNKYSTWEWTFGYSPDYQFTSKIRTETESGDVFLQIEKGVIKTIHISGISDTEEVENFLVGVKHNESIVRKTLKEKHFPKDIFFDIEPLIKALF